MDMAVGRKGRLRCMERVTWNIYYHMQNREPMGICCMKQGTETGLSNDLEGWHGEGGGRDAQVGGDTGKPRADSG